MSAGIGTILKQLGNPPAGGNQNRKRRYSERFSAEVSTWFADGLRGKSDQFATVSPSPEGSQQERRIEIDPPGAVKRVDIACTDARNDLVLVASIKTFSFRDARSKRYSKNYTGRLYELYAEAIELHTKYPDAVLIGLIFLPYDSCSDSSGKSTPSSFGAAVRTYRKVSGRASHEGPVHKFERVYVGLYKPSGWIRFFDVEHPPKLRAPPRSSFLTSKKVVIEDIVALCDARRTRRLRRRSTGPVEFDWDS